MIVLATLSFSAALFGGVTLAMLAPAYTRALVLWVQAPERSGLSAEETVRHAENARAYVAGVEDIELAERLDDGRPAFDAWAVSHLADVRVVLARVRVAAAVAAAAAVAWSAWAMSGARYRVRALAASLAAAAWLVIGVVAAGAAFALLDFSRFFTLFHAVFFEAETWVFPSEALLVRLFPEEFWMVSGGVWAGLSVFGAALMALGARIARVRAMGREE